MAEGATQRHIPVLRDRVVELLAVGPDDLPGGAAGLLVDATIGAGGHAAALLAASAPEVRLVGFDRDPSALALAADRLAAFGDRVRLVHGGYDALDAELADRAEEPLLGVLYDLGVSSMQLDDPGRGFAFRVDEPLDMRMDPGGDESSAADLVNGLDAGELAGLIRRYGEERHARRIAAAIVRARPVRSTGQLAELVRAAVPANVRFGRIHPATRTFQALRIVVNAELDRFRASLPQALERLRPADTAAPGTPSSGTTSGRGGRVVVLSYHSLEDRIAKRAFADAAHGCICPPDLPVCACGRTPWVRDLTRGVERPSEQEVAENPRARPAKLRAVEKTAPPPGRS